MLPLSLNDIAYLTYKEKCPFTFIKIYQTLTYVNGLESTGKPEITIIVYWCQEKVEADFVKITKHFTHSAQSPFE